MLIIAIKMGCATFCWFCDAGSHFDIILIFLSIDRIARYDDGIEQNVKRLTIMVQYRIISSNIVIYQLTNLHVCYLEMSWKWFAQYIGLFMYSCVDKLIDLVLRYFIGLIYSAKEMDILASLMFTLEDLIKKEREMAMEVNEIKFTRL